MSSNSILGSVNSEKQWVLEMDQNFTPEHTVDINFYTTTCVFRVPKSLSETKPEAYVPQHLGLGPYHHLRPEFYVMQKEKVSAVRRFLGAEKLQNFNKVVEALIQWEPVVRACYDQYLDLDIRTLARILAIDALYLLQFFKASGSGEVAETEEFAGDIITRESQIIEKFAGDIATRESQIIEKFAGDIATRESQIIEKFAGDFATLESQIIEKFAGDIIRLENQLPEIEKLAEDTIIEEDEIPEIKKFSRHIIRLENEIPATEEFAGDIIILENQIPELTEEFAGDIIMLENQTPGMEKFAGDIMMLENQMPLILLKKIQQVLQLEEVVDQDYVDHALFRGFQLFCQAYSPLKLNQQQQQIPEDMTQLHLLHRLYYLIVTYRGKDEIYRLPKKAMMSPMSALRGLIAVFGFLAARGMHGAEAVVKALTFILKLPMDGILALFRKGGPGEQIPHVEKIDIPTVSQMSGTAGIKFKSSPGGIRDIKYVVRKDGKMLFLPSIRLDANSEVILRNLVAYEAASAKPGSTLELAEYVDLMCGIIDTTKDVQILKKAKIILGQLPDEEIVRIFNGINKSTKRTDKKSNVEDAIDNINERYHGLVSVKVKKFLKFFFHASWNFLSVLITVAVLVVLTLEAFCSVFGCGRWFGKGTTLQIHNLLFSDQ